MAAVSLFWDTNMATMTSCENPQYVKSKLSICVMLKLCYNVPERPIWVDRIQQLENEKAVTFFLL